VPPITVNDITENRMPGIFNIRIPDTHIGSGAITRISSIIKDFDPKRVLIITDAGIMKTDIIKTIKSLLDKDRYRVDIFDGCREEAPITIIEELRQKIKAGGYDVLIGVGGGSTLDTTKVVSLTALNDDITIDNLLNGIRVKKKLPKILVPTTAGSGAEWSHLASITDDKVDNKTKLLLTPQNLPDAVIIDPDLTLELPAKITADTGMDALAHAVESYIGRRATIISDMHAETAIKLIAKSLPLVYAEGNKHVNERYNMSVAASLAIIASIITGAGLAHFISLSLGKKAYISHGRAVTLMLPYVMRFNLEANVSRFAKIAEFMGENISNLSESDAALKSVEAIIGLSRQFQIPQRLSDVGVHEADIPGLVDELLVMAPAIKAMNPRDLSREDAISIYKAAL